MGRRQQIIADEIRPSLEAGAVISPFLLGQDNPYISLAHAAIPIIPPPPLVIPPKVEVPKEETKEA